MKMEIFVFKEVEFHKIDEVSNVRHVHVIKNSGSEKYKRKNIKNFAVPCQQIMAEINLLQSSCVETCDQNPKIIG